MDCTTLRIRIRIGHTKRHCLYTHCFDYLFFSLTFTKIFDKYITSLFHIKHSLKMAIKGKWMFIFTMRCCASIWSNRMNMFLLFLAVLFQKNEFISSRWKLILIMFSTQAGSAFRSNRKLFSFHWSASGRSVTHQRGHTGLGKINWMLWQLLV
jgi:hypothetical protein